MPLSKAHLLDLSLDVGKGCEGIRATAWEACRIFRASVCNLISSDWGLRVSWHPLYVNFGVWSCLEDAIEVVDYPDDEMLSGCCSWGEGPPDDCLVAHKYLDGVGL